MAEIVLDANVLVALADAGDVHHRRAHELLVRLRAVVLSSLWPRISWMNRTSAPPSSIKVAIVCRKTWHAPALPMPARPT